jgi:hypothetical protein
MVGRSVAHWVWSSAVQSDRKKVDLMVVHWAVPMVDCLVIETV